jgi:hypothetical protein
VISSVLLEASLWVKRAIVKCINKCTVIGKLLLHPSMEGADIILRIIAVTDTRLIG